MKRNPTQATPQPYTPIRRVAAILMMCVRIPVLLFLFTPVSLLLRGGELVGTTLSEFFEELRHRWKRLDDEFRFLTNGHLWRLAEENARELWASRESERLLKGVSDE